MPDFAPAGGLGALAYRPERAVPIQVPIYDESASRRGANALERAQGEDTAPAALPEEAEPVHAWKYRPEMQFSVFGFTPERLQAGVDADGDRTIDDDEREVIDLTDDEADLSLPGRMDALDLLYSIEEPGFDPLERLGPDRELVFGFGSEEVQLTVDADGDLASDGDIRFEHPEHLTRLDDTDLVTLRLIDNNDASNVLWENVVDLVGLLADQNGDGAIEWRFEADPRRARTGGPVRLASAVGVASINGLPLLASATTTDVEDIDVFDSDNSRERPFRFWGTDDDDYGAIAFTDDDNRPDDTPQIREAYSGPGTGSTLDYENLHIDGMRDLVDFFPVFTDLKSAIDKYGIDGYSYKLLHPEIAFFFVTTDLGRKAGNAEKGLRAPLVDPEQTESIVGEGGSLSAVTADGAPLNRGYLERIRDGKIAGIILLEAVGKTSAPMTIEVPKKKTGRLVAADVLHLSIDGVENMYRHINLQGAAQDREGARVPGLETNTGNPPNLPDDETDPNYFLLLHGCCNSGVEARGIHADIFKRLYQLGFTGRFIGTSSYGDAGQFAYHHSVYNAFRTAQVLPGALRNALSELESGPGTVAAHSLGNIVVSEAISKYALDVDRYYMINAVSPVEAYDPTQSLGSDGQSTTDRMVQDEWLDHPDGVYAANWHDLFDESDGRRDLTWEGRFAPVLDVAYNFYSPGDQVLASPDSAQNAFEEVCDRVKSDEDLGTWRHAWILQEYMKGCNTVPDLAEPDNCSAGWEFNGNGFQVGIGNDMAFVGTPLTPANDADPASYRVYRPDEAVDALALDSRAADPDGLTAGELAQFGFFRPFAHYSEDGRYIDLYAPIGSDDKNIGHNRGERAVANALAARLDTQFDLLASAIPSLSFASGANVMPIVGQINEGKNNYNMENLRDPSQWPVPRQNGGVQVGKDWLHSDFTNTALPYVHRVY